MQFTIQLQYKLTTKRYGQYNLKAILIITKNIIFLAYRMNTIAAYSNHLDEEDMGTEWYKEAVERMQAVAPAHCNMDHAIQDMRVGRTHG